MPQYVCTVWWMENAHIFLYSVSYEVCLKMKKQHSIYIFWLLLVLSFSLMCFSCTFLKAWYNNPERVGEVVPSSSRVAKVMSDRIKTHGDKKYLLEVGAGEGALTDKIIQKLRDIDHLDLIEIEPIFCKELSEKFGAIKNITIHCLDFLTWKPSYQYDHVVTSLPFNSFPPSLTEQLMKHLLEVTKENGTISFYEFKWLPQIRHWFMNEADTKIQAQNREHIENFIKNYLVYQTTVYLNFPPVIVYHLEK